MAGAGAREVVAVSRACALPIDAAGYRPHALHADRNVWVEKNCYIDIWIEVLHALQLDPLAVLACTVAIDFEGDQFTFFKPPHQELWELYGVDVQELNVWRPLLAHAQEHLARGTLISTEADAFWLPDTQGTDYRRQHTKTTIVLADLDLGRSQLGYFHNASYHTLQDEDFVQTFRVGFAADPAFLPLFAETIRFERIARRSHGELLELARPMLARHLARRPASNPVTRFGERLAADWPQTQAAGLDYYHAWAFATIRQLGAAAELLAAHLNWRGDLETAAAAFATISTGSKALILKAARSVNSRKPLDASALLGEMAAAWQRGMDAIGAAS